MRIGDFGQPRLEELLDEMLARGRVGGSFLFDGPVGVGKEALAVELGRRLNCEHDTPCAAKPPFALAAEGGRPASRAAAPRAARCNSCHKFDILQHPDLLLVFPVPRDTWNEPMPEARGGERKLNTIGRILKAKAANPYYREDFDDPTNIEADLLREKVIPTVYSRPVEGRIKTVVISDCEQMAHDMGNLLLKTLEEPPADCLLVLATSVPQRLLPTILSRCQRLRFAPLAPEWMQPRLVALLDAPPAKARLAAAVSQGSMLAATRFLAGDLDEVRDRAFEALQAAAAGQQLELLDLAAALAKERAEKRYIVPLFLQLLAAAARDALLVATGLGDADKPAGAERGPRLVNEDRRADLDTLARVFAPEELRALLRAAEACERQIAGHAVAEHALARLFLGIAPPEVASSPRQGGRR